METPWRCRGTGLGEAYLPPDRRPSSPGPLEGPRGLRGPHDRETVFVRMLRDRYGRAEVEQVLSGPGS